METIEVTRNMKVLLERLMQKEGHPNINCLIWDMFVEYTSNRGMWDEEGKYVKSLKEELRNDY